MTFIGRVKRGSHIYKTWRSHRRVSGEILAIKFFLIHGGDYETHALNLEEVARLGKSQDVQLAMVASDIPDISPVEYVDADDATTVESITERTVEPVAAVETVEVVESIKEQLAETTETVEVIENRPEPIHVPQNTSDVNIVFSPVVAPAPASRLPPPVTPYIPPVHGRPRGRPPKK